MSIELTQRAAEELKHVLEEQQLDPAKMRLRVGVKGQTVDRHYTLDVDDSVLAQDKVFTSQGFTVVCLEKDLGVLDQTTIDFKESGGVSGFVFNVPEKEHLTTGQTDQSAPPPTYEQVRQALYKVYDPEVGVNIIDLGLLFDLKVEERNVHVRMTLTTPACPLEEHIRGDINQHVRTACPGTDAIGVTIVWQPRWSPELMTPEGKKQLGWSR